MKWNIYGPENRIVSAQMGVGYSMGVYLLAAERVRYAALVHSSLGTPSVANISSSYVPGPTIDGYGSGTSYVTWGVYNSAGVLVATYSGSRWTKTVSVGGGGASFEFVEVNWPSTGNASWYVRNGSGIGSTSGLGSESDVPTTPISPTYYEQLEADKENNVGGDAQMLLVSDGSVLGRLYSDHWSNNLNGSLSRYYTHYAAFYPPLWGGYTGLAYYNVDLTTAEGNGVRTMGTHRVAESLPDDVLTGITEYPHAEVYEVWVDNTVSSSGVAPATPLDRGDGRLVDRVSQSTRTQVYGPGLPLADWENEYGEIKQQRIATILGSLTFTDSEKPSKLIAGATLARLTFHDYYIRPSYPYPAVRNDGRMGFISGTYVEGYENTLSFVPQEQHSVLVQAAGVDSAKVREVYEYLREEVARANSHIAAWATRSFKKTLADCLSHSFVLPHLHLKKIRESAKKSAGAYRDPELTVTVSDVTLSSVFNPGPNQYESVVQRTVNMEYTVVVEGENVTRRGTERGTLAVTYEKAPGSTIWRQVRTYNNYYQPVSTWGGGLPFSDGAAVRASDFASGSNAADYPHGVSSGFTTVTGRYMENAIAARPRAYTILDETDRNLHSWMTLQRDYGFYGADDAEAGFQVSVPSFIEQYLAEVPVKYRDTTGTPKWVETAMYDGQIITLTWFGPRGKGAHAPWADTDTEVEVYGQLVCRYDEKSSRLRGVAWKNVSKPNSTYTVPNVRRIVTDSDGKEWEILEEVVLPTRVAHRPACIPRTYPYRYLGNNTPRDGRNCVVTFSSVKWPDVKAAVQAEAESVKELDTLEKVILGLV